MNNLGELSAQLTPVVIVNENGEVVGGTSGAAVVGPTVDPADGRITGQIVVPTAGTAVQGPDVPLTNGVWIGADPDNTGDVAYGNDGFNNVTLNNGIVLETGKFGPPLQVENLNKVWFNAAVNGEKFMWQKG